MGTNAIDKDAIIAALRETATHIQTSDKYTVTGKQQLYSMCEDMLDGLKESNDKFWERQRFYSSRHPDGHDLVMDYVFASLNVDTIDPIAESLA